jgi:hypothetical protein
MIQGWFNSRLRVVNLGYLESTVSSTVLAAFYSCTGECSKDQTSVVLDVQVEVMLIEPCLKLALGI